MHRREERTEPEEMWGFVVGKHQTQHFRFPPVCWWSNVHLLRRSTEIDHTGGSQVDTALIWSLVSGVHGGGEKQTFLWPHVLTTTVLTIFFCYRRCMWPARTRTPWSPPTLTPSHSMQVMVWSGWLDQSWPWSSSSVSSSRSSFTKSEWDGHFIKIKCHLFKPWL